MHVVETIAVVIAGPMVAVEVAASAFGVAALRRVLPYWYLVSLAALLVAAAVTAEPLIIAAAAAMAVVVAVTVRATKGAEWVRVTRVLLLLAVVVLLSQGIA